jgi:hypothetical protein
MFDRSTCAKVCLAAEAHANLLALATLAAFLRDALNKL